LGARAFNSCPWEPKRCLGSKQGHNHAEVKMSRSCTTTLIVKSTKSSEQLQF
jgi:hypothetical protein